MFGCGVRRRALGLGLMGLFLFVGTGTGQPTNKLIDRILKDVQSRKRVKPKSDDSELQQLLVKRYNLAVEEVQSRCDDYKKGLSTLDKVIQSCRDMLTADLERSTDPHAKIKALERVISIVSWYETELEAGLKEGIGLRSDLLHVRHSRLNLEIQVLQIKETMPMPK